MINRDDPFNLLLVYVQSKDSIVSGEHPTIKSEAVSLAALQCQIQMGTYNPESHKKGFLVTNLYLPKSYQKDKTMEDLIVKEWKKLVGLDDMNAKYRYVQMCRSLKTYGITSFEASISDTKSKKFKQYIKLKLALGVNRVGVILIDNETKAILEQWPLTTLKRWASTEGTITLDFGSYADEYIIFATEKGEAITSLISGYIDIILKSRRDANKMIETGEGEIANIEKIGIIGNQGVMSTTTSYYSGVNAFGQSSMSMVGSGLSSSATGLGKAQKMKITDLKTGSSSVALLLSEVEQMGQKVPGHMNRTQWNQQLETELNNLIGHANGLLEMGATPTKFDKVKLDDLGKMLALTTQNVLTASRNAALVGDDKLPELFLAGKAMADAMRKLLDAAN